MLVKDLAKKLSELDQEAEIALLDCEEMTLWTQITVEEVTDRSSNFESDDSSMSKEKIKYQIW